MPRSSISRSERICNMPGSFLSCDGAGVSEMLELDSILYVRAPSTSHLSQMIQPLDPLRLTPSASLYRARTVDLPGLQTTDDVRGRSGYELISARALCALIRSQAHVLRLSDAELALADRELPIRFNACFESPDDRVHKTARVIGETLGRRMGCLLAMLKCGDPINRAARADW